MERNDKSLSERQIKAYEYFLKGRSLAWIGKKLKVSKTTSHRWIENVKALIKNNKGVLKGNDKPLSKKRNDLKEDKLKRLHNDVVSFLIEPINFWGEKNIIKLKYVQYILIKDFEGLHIQLFPHKLVVRFLDDISCRTIKECKFLAENRIITFLKNFNYKGVRFLGGKYEQVSRHYAILGTALAKKYVREKRKFYVFDKVDGKRRLVIDYSHDKPEFEAEHNIKGFKDISRSEKVFDDYINKSSYLPSETKNILDIIIGVQKDYAENIKLHLDVMKDIKKSMREIKNHIKKD